MPDKDPRLKKWLFDKENGLEKSFLFLETVGLKFSLKGLPVDVHLLLHTKWMGDMPLLTHLTTMASHMSRYGHLRF